MTIIVGIDGYEHQQHEALALAADLAQSDDGRLLVAHVYPWSRWDERLGNAYELTVRDDAKELLAAAAAGDELEGTSVETRALPELSVPRALHRLADESDADLIVIGSTHRGPIGRTLVGGTGERVLHGSPCPVAVAPHGYRRSDRKAKRIGVALDDSAEARAALSWAGNLAARIGADVTVLEVYEPVVIASGYPGAAIGYDVLDAEMQEACKRRVDEAVASLPDSVHAVGHVLNGPVANALAEAAEDLDLLVTGSRSYGPARSLLLGSVARRLSHVAPCPLVVLPRSATPEAEPQQPASAAATG